VEEEHRLMASQKKVLRNILQYKNGETTEEKGRD
jgi:hypothetical protein